MFINKTKHIKTLKKNQEHHPNPHKSIVHVEEFIVELLLMTDLEIERVERQKYVDSMLGKIAYLSSLINIEDFFHQGLTFEPNKSKFTADNEPIPISLDNFSRPKLTKTDKTTVKQLSITSRVTTLTKSEAKSDTLKIKKKERSVKLELEPIEQKKVFSDLRQRKIDEENEKVNKVQLQEQERKKMERKNKLTLNSGFDYNGQLLTRIDINRSNLVEKVLTLKLNNLKMAKRNPKPQLSSVNQVKKKGYKKIEKNEKEQTEFQAFMDSQSLTDSVEISRGIRYSTNSLVFQEKKKTISIPDLKSRLGRRRMSKSEFAGIRNYVQKKQMSKYQKIKTENQGEKEYTLKRAFSEANINSWLKQKQSIRVANPELRESMLIRLEDYQPFLVIEKEFPDEEVPCLAKEREPNLSLGQGNSEISSRVTQFIPITPKLPQLSKKDIRQRTPQPLILVRLQQQLRNKQKL